MIKIISRILLFVMVSPLFAETGDVVKVGVRDVPPFSFKDSNGNWQGLSVDLWRELAGGNGLQVDWIEQPTVPALFDQLESGEIHLIASSVSMTAEREKRFDFSHPFLSSNLAILARHEEVGPWMRVFQTFFSWPFLAAMSSLALVLLGAGTALYFFERRSNQEQFSAEPVKGLGDAFWWAAVTMTTVGYGDKAPNSLGGRLVALLWMFISVIILSTFTAAIVSSLSLPGAERKINGLADLNSGMVATVENSTADKLLNAVQLNAIDVKTFDEIKKGLMSGQFDAYVFDKPTLQYYMKALPDSFYLIDLEEHQEDYAFVLREGSGMQESINRQLLDFMASPKWHDMKNNYLN